MSKIHHRLNQGFVDMINRATIWSTILKNQFRFGQICGKSIQAEADFPMVDIIGPIN